MGFRDLHAFNLAMLAKQSWRMITHPDTLCAKKGSSFTWQSIFAGLQTFRRGHIWRVGYGEKINIWEDHWVPSSPTRMIQTRKGNVLLRTVDELIDPNTGAWDVELVGSLFLPIDAERILRIPLSVHLNEDFVAWNKTKSHSFSVRSAYYSECEHQFGSKIISTEGTSNVNLVWSAVWKLEVPSKIKIFIW